MRCRFCGERAGWLRRWCSECDRLWNLWQERRPAPLGELLDVFLATGVSVDKIDRFLDADTRGVGGTIRDQIVADVTNALLAALGQHAPQDAASVMRLRRRGTWKRYDQPPESG